MKGPVQQKIERRNYLQGELVFAVKALNDGHELGHRSLWWFLPGSAGQPTEISPEMSRMFRQWLRARRDELERIIEQLDAEIAEIDRPLR